MRRPEVPSQARNAEQKSAATNCAINVSCVANFVQGFSKLGRKLFELGLCFPNIAVPRSSAVRYQPVAAKAATLSTNVNIEGIDMNLTAFIEGIEALEQLMPSVLSFVNKVHPGADQAAQKAATAVAITSSVLTSAGVEASTVASLQAGVQAAASAPLSTATAPVAATATETNGATSTDTAAADGTGTSTSAAPAAAEANAGAQASAS